jgi:hypothetical protein
VTVEEFSVHGFILGQSRQTLGNNCCNSFVCNFLMNLERCVTKYCAALHGIDLLYLETGGNTGQDCTVTDGAEPSPDIYSLVSLSNYNKLINTTKKASRFPEPYETRKTEYRSRWQRTMYVDY